MSNQDLQQEIELLRQQLDAIQQQADAAPDDTAPDDTRTEKPAEAEPAVTPDDEAQAEDLLAQLKELLESIDQDIKDAKPTTLLIVFALGVLVGRL